MAHGDARFLEAVACCALVALLATSPLGAAAATVEIGRPLPAGRAPKWDARGLGPLPWQGIACADMTDDGRWVALGTIAPPGDPHAFLLDERGKVLEQVRAGERWIDAVAVGEAGSFLAALCTTPMGRSGDRPTLKVFVQGKEVPELSASISNDLAKEEWFHYGDHSNHLPRAIRAAGRRLAVAAENGLRFVPPQGAAASGKAREGDAKPASPASSYGKTGPAALTALAVGPDGRAAVGLAVRQADRSDASRGLVVLEEGRAAPLWSRPVCDDAAAPPPLERGVYGPATPACADTPVWAPLAVAMDAAGRRVASADYRGWDRRFDGGKRGSFLRFMPARPSIHIYEAEGKPVRQFGPETFAEPFWCDLAFSADGRRLLAFPHAWTSRGLGGQPVLPADEGARTLYALDLETGDVRSVRFPDAISSVAAAGSGRTVVGCWDGHVYILDAALRPIAALPEGLDVGAATLVRASRDGSHLLVAGADGVARMLDGDGRELWRTDLNRAAQPGDKPWTRPQPLSAVGPGVWRKNGARTHSDMGSQFIIEAPEGLLLIDPNGGLSIEQTWAQIKASGLDPMQVKYVLLTHEHGDHAPGGYLWRVLTGAQVVGSPEMAYNLQHHSPACSGYGFHPPQPTDVVVSKDGELTLAGLKVKVLRLPGHTYGSLGFAFEKEGRTYVSTGDLIMPGGTLGYSGSLDFSAQDVLASLRKLAALKPDVVLGGHGSGEPDHFIAKGIAAGEATAWGRATPEKPDRFFAFSQKNYLVVGWLERIVSAAYGDADGDGRPDVVLLCQEAAGPVVKVYLNRQGTFADKPDLVQPVSDLATDATTKVRLLRLGGGKGADLYVCTDRGGAAILLAQEGRPGYRQVTLPGVQRATHALVTDLNHDGRPDLVLGQRFTGAFSTALQSPEGAFRVAPGKTRVRSYFDIYLVDINGDGKEDLATSGGDLFLRQPDGSLPDQPTLHVAVPEAEKTWLYLAADDFNADGRPDLVFLAHEEKQPLRVHVFYHCGDPQRPFRDKPDATFSPPDAAVLRDGPTAGDWNGDGIPDLVVAATQGALVLPGSRQGLDAKRTVAVPLDYKPHYDTRFGVADFNGDGKADLAGWGPSPVGAPAVYIWLQP